MGAWGGAGLPLLGKFPLQRSRDQVGHSNIISLHPRQPWPVDLPLVTVSTEDDGAEVEVLDMGVVLYSCSFAVIFLMILSQVMDRNNWLDSHGGQEMDCTPSSPFASNSLLHSHMGPSSFLRARRTGGLRLWCPYINLFLLF